MLLGGAGLGRGAGAPGGKKGGTLRGVWGVDSITNATLTGNANVSGDTLIGAQAITNAILDQMTMHPTFAQTTNIVQSVGVTFTNGTTMSDGVYNTTNGVFFTRRGTNYWILLD